MKLLLVTQLQFLFLIGTAQVTLERQVIGSTALNGNVAGIYLATTAGQAAYRTEIADQHILTQGFEQPLHYDEGEPVLELTMDECTGEIIIEFVEYTGCLTDSVYVINWNDMEGLEEFVITADSVNIDVFGAPGCHFESTVFPASELVTVLPCENDFYELITPNNDGANDGWFIERIDDPEFAGLKVKIFNRWGMEVWSAGDYDNHNVLWTGLSNEGKELPDGTYFYTVETTIRAYSGFVELQR